MPREWPPLSVWLLGGSLFLPFAGLATYARRVADPYWWLPTMWAVLGLVAASAILGRKNRDGSLIWVIVGSVALLSLLVCVLVTSAARTLNPPPTSRVQFSAVVGLLAGLEQVGLLLWPETRRWCGLLPPRDDD